MLAIQLFLAFNFYSTYQKDAASDRRTKYEPSWNSETGFESRGLADSSVSAVKVRVSVAGRRVDGLGAGPDLSDGGETTTADKFTRLPRLAYHL